MRLTRVIKLGMSGDDVKFIQTRLKELGLFPYSVDGNFGQNLVVSVMSFQKSKSISVDGEIGHQTWSQLIN